MSDSVLSEIDELLDAAARAAHFEGALPEPAAQVTAAPAAAPPSAPAGELDPATLQLVAQVATAVATALPPALAQVQAAAGAAAVPVPATSSAGKVTGLYARYLGLFVGAGLMAGAVVHFPLAPFRYAIMGIVGAIIFAIGSIGDGFSGRTGGARAVYIGASLALALGVGMVAGGIQHFEDVPGRATVLIPVGLLIGLGAFLLRDGHRLASDQLGWLAGGAVLLAAVLGFGLSTMVPPPGEAGAAGGHAHGAAEAAPAGGDAHAPAVATPAAPAAQAAPAASGVAPAPGAASEPPVAPQPAPAAPAGSRYASPADGH
jgi:hypothetical protein